MAIIAFIAHQSLRSSRHPVLHLRDQLHLYEVDTTHAHSMSNIHRRFLIACFWTIPADQEACLDIGSVVDIKA
jgi:hypothetical protein